MKFLTRHSPTPPLPGVVGTARVERRAGRLLSRLRPGDVAVLDHVDMDAALARALVEAGVVAVVNAAPMISGRYPNLGPGRLVEAGVEVLDSVGAEALAKVGDGSQVRLDGATLVLADGSSLEGRRVDATLVEAELAAARSGMSAQLESLAHNSTAFLRREEDVLLHGQGVPELPRRGGGRPGGVAGPGAEGGPPVEGGRGVLRGEEAPFLRGQKPLLIAVDAAADAVMETGRAAEVVVVSTPEGALPSPEALGKAELVVVLVGRGAGRAFTEPLERLGVRAERFETTATAQDAALILADAAAPSLIVGVGLHATLEEFLDRDRAGTASTFLTRLKVAPRLVDASAVPTLYDGAVRPRHVAALSVFGAALAAAAISVTPVGQEWVAEAGTWLGDLYDYFRGLFA